MSSAPQPRVPTAGGTSTPGVRRVEVEDLALPTSQRIG